ncbi:MAG: hypothetical protein PHH54_02200 [Candidatus Nanoarchaeia archaeon]|nr:hypothetical protein [Candidatus Nanoarchaeia archaeon]MDD5740773.1 hypothetical protein [Candidatus Nanoarchaeia archaeon]
MELNRTEPDKNIYAQILDIEDLASSLSNNGYFIEKKPIPDVTYGWIFDRKLKLHFNVAKIEIKNGTYELHCFTNSEGFERVKEFASSYHNKSL